MKPELRPFDYMKLLLMNVIIALVIALAFVGFVYADGVDDPNFYKDFNPNNPQHKYEFFAPPEWKLKQEYNIQPIPYNSYFQRILNIPEPSELLLLSVGTAGLCAWRWYK